MTETGSDYTPPPPPEKPNSFARIAGVFFDPGDTFASIVRKPDFLVPICVISFFAIIGGVLAGLRLDTAALMREALQNNPRLSPEMIDKQARLMGGFMKLVFFCSPIVSIISLAIIAGILFAAFKLFGGEGEFPQALSIILYAWMPMMIKGILGTALLLSKKSITMETLKNPIASNIGYFINFKAHPVLATFLASADVFTIWYIVLLTIGFAAMSRFSRAKSAAIIVSLWAVTVFLQVAGAAVSALAAARSAQ